MPKKLEDKLKREAKKRGLTGKRRLAFIYGTLQRIEKRKPKKR